MRRCLSVLMPAMFLLCGLLLSGPAASAARGDELSPAQRQYLAEKGTITFISQSHYPPFEFIAADDGARTGMCIDLVRWMAAELGFRVRFVDAPFREAQERVLAGDADVLTGLSFSDRRDEEFDFTRMMFAVPASIFVVAERTDIHGLQDLRGRCVAMQAGGYAAGFLERLGIVCEIVPAASFAATVDLVLAGRADAVIGDEQVVWHHVYSSNLAESIKKVGEPLYVGRNCMAVKGGNRKLLSIIDIGIARAQAQGVLDRITRTWLGERYAPPCPWWREYGSVLLAAGPALALLLLWFWWWHRRLKAEVADRTAALRSSEATLQAILAASPVGIGVSRGRRIEWYNQALARMLDGGETELVGRDVRQLYPDNAAFHAAVAAVKPELEAGRSGPVAVRWQRRDGAVIDCRLHFAPLPGEGADNLPRTIYTVEDTTGQRRRDAELARSENRLRAILAANPNPMVVYDDRGHPTYLNPAFTELFGWTAEELAGGTIPFVPESEREQAMAKIRELYATGRVPLFTTRRLTKKGDMLDIMLSARLVHDTAGRAVEMVVNLADITAVKELKSRLRQAEKMEVVGTLAGGIAHDFNNILTAIMGFAEIGREKIRAGTVPDNEYGRITAAAERARNLVKQLLAFSRQTEPEMVPLDLNRLCAQTMEMIERVIPKMITVDLRLAADLPPATGDHHQLSLVLLNLCGNAADAMPEGGTIRIETGRKRVSGLVCAACGDAFSGDLVRLRVADTGCGMDAETRKRMFDPFFTTKEVGKGTGLGMSTVYGIVKGHVGHVTCESAPGAGTIIDVFLPVAAVPAAVVDPPRRAPGLGEEVHGTETILLVDDEDDIREVGRELLTTFGYRLMSAASGEEALEIYRQAGGDPVDLVILDLSMPGMGGFACLAELKRLNPDIKVVIASGYFPENLPADTPTAAAYLHKPYSHAQLLTTIRRILDSARA
ncbi:MAG: transporter substrate-binding domain-containing protein [Deltaproteobacteria bacterium]|nr:transporter substrate-binding domain-containing protein [Candidatus Anaeroferrophillacea bacterium]